MGQPEPWLRGTHRDLDAVVRQVVHALELASEDVNHWCAALNDEEMNARPMGLTPLAYHLRHIPRSLDRLLSYAEGTQLDETQLAALKSELDAGAAKTELMREFESGLSSATQRILAFRPEQYNAERAVGRKMLPTTVGGLLVHCADHTQRHTGQIVTTTKVLIGLRG
jgi:uncharacterized damage-inducible protein DinB